MTKAEMENGNLTNKETEKLESQLKAIKIITGGVIAALALLFIVSIYGLIVNENKSTFMALATSSIALCGILPLLFIVMKNIKSKLNTRIEKN